MNKDKQEFFDYLTTAEGPEMTVMMYTKTEEQIWHWIESKKEQWQREAREEQSKKSFETGWLWGVTHLKNLFMGRVVFPSLTNLQKEYDEDLKRYLSETDLTSPTKGNVER